MNMRSGWMEATVLPSVPTFKAMVQGGCLCIFSLWHNCLKSFFCNESLQSSENISYINILVIEKSN